MAVKWGRVYFIYQSIVKLIDKVIASNFFT